jgi:predicted nucleic acid-binding protein
LVFGASRSQKPENSMIVCRQFCSSFQLVGLDQEAAERSGVIRAQLEGRGERIGAYDVLIAAIALARSYVLTFGSLRAWLAYRSKTGRRSHNNRLQGNGRLPMSWRRSIFDV